MITNEPVTEKQSILHTEEGMKIRKSLLDAVNKITPKRSKELGSLLLRIAFQIPDFIYFTPEQRTEITNAMYDMEMTADAVKEFKKAIKHGSRLTRPEAEKKLLKYLRFNGCSTPKEFKANFDLLFRTAMESELAELVAGDPPDFIREYLFVSALNDLRIQHENGYLEEHYCWATPEFKKKPQP